MAQTPFNYTVAFLSQPRRGSRAEFVAGAVAAGLGDEALAEGAVDAFLGVMVELTLIASPDFDVAVTYAVGITNSEHLTAVLQTVWARAALNPNLATLTLRTRRDEVQALIDDTLAKVAVVQVAIEAMNDPDPATEAGIVREALEGGKALMQNRVAAGGRVVEEISIQIARLGG